MAEHQRSLFATGPPGIRDGAAFERRALVDGAWIDVARGWVAGADDLLDVLVNLVPWRRGRRRMYERVLDDPRLSHWYREGDPLPHPVLAEIGEGLATRYRVPFGAVGLNYYCDGRDSVAPHADRELRDLDDTIVAVVTLGSRRPFLVRPTAGGTSIDLAPESGDLLVMGGTCQRLYRHAVPKVVRAGPRVSATWRWARHDRESPPVTTLQ